jgi:hypothetical protein
MGLGKFPHPSLYMGIPMVSYCCHGDGSGEFIPDGDLPIANTTYDDDFDVLNWWHEHKLTFTVLCLLAKDIMTVPVSTTSSESTFSLSGRVIEERRRRLGADTVEMLICTKDWELGEEHGQHTVVDKELEDYMKNQFLDEDAEVTEASKT